MPESTGSYSTKQKLLCGTCADLEIRGCRCRRHFSNVTILISGATDTFRLRVTFPNHTNFAAHGSRWSPQLARSGRWIARVRRSRVGFGPAGRLRLLQIGIASVPLNADFVISEISPASPAQQWWSTKRIDLPSSAGTRRCGSRHKQKQRHERLHPQLQGAGTPD